MEKITLHNGDENIKTYQVSRAFYNLLFQKNLGISNSANNFNTFKDIVNRTKAAYRNNDMRRGLNLTTQNILIYNLSPLPI